MNTSDQEKEKKKAKTGSPSHLRIKVQNPVLNKIEKEKWKLSQWHWRITPYLFVKCSPSVTADTSYAFSVETDFFLPINYR